MTKFCKPSKLNYLFIFLLLSIRGNAQGNFKNWDYKAALRYLQLKEYTVITKSDTIYFLTTLPDKKKKTIVFCQGSGPVPLIIKTDQGFYPPFPFQIDSNTRKEFNIVIVSKPGIKRFATSADINAALLKQGQLLQLDSMYQAPQKYTDNNNLYKLAGDCIAVIKFLRKQPWVDKDNIYVFGHSQGAHVAAYVAYKDPKDIKGLIYSQSNAYGIAANYLSSILYRQPPANDVNKQMDSIYHLEADLLADKKDKDVYDPLYGGWRSLEEPPTIEYLLKINMPMLLLNGLASPGELDNKNIPLDFMRHDKHNLTAKFYPGYNHNFFKRKFDEKGNEIEPEFHWDDIFADVKNWINGLSNS